MAYSVLLTVPAATVGSTLTDFPVRVNLADLPTAWWTDTTTDLGNVRVKSAGSVIPFDIVAYDRTAETGELFFKSTLTTSANTFTIETVDGATALAVTDTNGRNNVWVDYLAVFITSGVGMADRMKDRAGKSGDLSVVTGTLGTPTNAGWLKGAGDVNVRSVGVGLNTTFHFGASYVMATASGNNSFLSYSTDSTTDGHRELLCLESGVNPAMYNSTNSFYEHLGSEPATPNAVVGVRERYVGVKNGTTNRYSYRNGVKGTTQAPVSARPTSPGNALWILCGNGATTSRFFGEVNYVYLRTGVSSDAWQDAEYESWENPSSFYTITDVTLGTLDAEGILPEASFSGTYIAPVSGTLDAEGLLPEASFSGIYDGPLAGTLAAEGLLPEAAFSGTYVAPTITGALAAVGLLPEVAFAGAYSGSPILGTLDAAGFVGEADFVGLYSGPTPSDTSNALAGRDRGASASVTVIVPAPAVTTPVRVDKAIPLPVPTMVDGRPT